jgi:hypothetical protein
MKWFITAPWFEKEEVNQYLSFKILYQGLVDQWTLSKCRRNQQNCDWSQLTLIMRGKLGMLFNLAWYAFVSETASVFCKKKATLFRVKRLLLKHVVKISLWPSVLNTFLFSSEQKVSHSGWEHTELWLWNIYNDMK